MTLNTHLECESEIVIFSKHNCPECVKVKSYLDENLIDYMNINISTISENEDEIFEIVDELKEVSQQKVYPFCFYKKNFITVQDLKKKLTFYNLDDF